MSLSLEVRLVWWRWRSQGNRNACIRWVLEQQIRTIRHAIRKNMNDKVVIQTATYTVRLRHDVSGCFLSSTANSSFTRAWVNRKQIVASNEALSG